MIAILILWMCCRRCVGSLVIGRTSDYFGPKRVMVATLFAGSCSLLLSSLAQTYNQFLLGRCGSPTNCTPSEALPKVLYVLHVGRASVQHPALVVVCTVHTGMLKVTYLLDDPSSTLASPGHASSSTSLGHAALSGIVNPARAQNTNVEGSYTPRSSLSTDTVLLQRKHGMAWCPSYVHVRSSKFWVQVLTVNAGSLYVLRKRPQI